MSGYNVLKGFRSARHRDVVAQAIQAGARVRDSGGHVILYPPSGPPVAVSRTAYDGSEGVVTIIAALRRGGIVCGPQPSLLKRVEPLRKGQR